MPGNVCAARWPMAAPVGSVIMRLHVESCPICGSSGEALGSKISSFSNLDFHFERCGSCQYTFITDPRIDFDKIYDGEYYAGRGADPNVEYLREMSQVDTLREYEWRG